MRANILALTTASLSALWISWPATADDGLSATSNPTPADRLSWWQLKSYPGLPAREVFVHVPAKAASAEKPTERHPLLVVLHGCFQDVRDLRDHGNLRQTADEAGFVIALPAVGPFDAWGPSCWDYDQAKDRHGHITEIENLTRKLVADKALGIDHKKVFIAGLSSGGALSLALGCAAPDLFAGVAAIAGPSVGSNQCLATAPGKLHGAPPSAAIDAAKQCEQLAGHQGNSNGTLLPVVPETAARDAVRACAALAGPHASSLSTQIVNVAFGSRDRDGRTKPKYAYHLFEPWLNLYPGKYEIASVDWARHNGRAYQAIYGSTDCKWEAPVAIGAKGTEISVRINGVTRISKLEMEGIGHAWPAGMADDGFGGSWIAQEGFNYPKYIMSWFLANHQRGRNGVAGPEVNLENAGESLCQ